VGLLHRSMRLKRTSRWRVGLRPVGVLPCGGGSLRVFILGGTGLIGSAIVQALIARGHTVLGLARSHASAARLAGWGVTPIAGDMRAPRPWARTLPPIVQISSGRDLTVIAQRCGISADARHLTSDILLTRGFAFHSGGVQVASGSAFLLPFSSAFATQRRSATGCRACSADGHYTILWRASRHDQDNRASHTKGRPRRPRTAAPVPTG
jgi:NAD(P)-dependent dehydrogenase (short-subunit alcohol dehydrogenase family)